MKNKKMILMICFMLVLNYVLPATQILATADLDKEIEEIILEDAEIAHPSTSPSIDSVFSEAGGEINPRFTNVNSFINAFDIVNGQAQISSYLSANNVTEAILYVYLYKDNGSGYTTYNYWQVTSNTPTPGQFIIASIGPNPFAVPRGKYYLQASGYVYNNGTFIEKVNYTSSVITY